MLGSRRSDPNHRPPRLDPRPTAAAQAVNFAAVSAEFLVTFTNFTAGPSVFGADRMGEPSRDDPWMTKTTQNRAIQMHGSARL